MTKNGSRKDVQAQRNSGSEPRVNPNTDSCGLCGNLFKDCNGHELELPGMHVGRQRD